MQKRSELCGIVLVKKLTQKVLKSRISKKKQVHKLQGHRVVERADLEMTGI